MFYRRDRDNELYRDDDTKEGYKGICLQSDSMSKIWMLTAIKTKTEDEIKDCHWLWIRKYGPAKTILSDQGKDLINKMLSKILENVGTEIRRTSSYNTRTVGLAVR